MDRLSQLRGEAGGSGDSTLDTTSPPSEGFLTANESSSKYFSLSEVDSTFDISSIKDVSLASTSAVSEGTITNTDDLISNLSPIGNKSDMLDSYKIGKHIEAANILSGGVDIFDDNEENSYDGDELVIDDNVDDEKISSEKHREGMLESTLINEETDIASKDSEVVLQIDGKNVDAIDIGNGLYLYRKEGEEELAAVQIVDDDQQQPSFKFLKVRENAEGNLEVYEEIEIEVPKEVPTKEGKTTNKSTSSHVPIKDINKVINDTASNKVAERKIKVPVKEKNSTKKVVEPNIKTETTPDNKTELNLNGKMMKFSESRKSPVIGSFTPMTFHSTPNKEGKPLTKTMVDQQLHPNRHSDNIKKTIEVHTDTIKQKITETSVKTEVEDKLEEDTINAGNDNIVVDERGATDNLVVDETASKDDLVIEETAAKDDLVIEETTAKDDLAIEETAAKENIVTDETDATVGILDNKVIASREEIIVSEDEKITSKEKVDENKSVIDIKDNKHDGLNIIKSSNQDNSNSNKSLHDVSIQLDNVVNSTEENEIVEDALLHDSNNKNNEDNVSITNVTKMDHITKEETKIDSSNVSAVIVENATSVDNVAQSDNKNEMNQNSNETIEVVSVCKDSEQQVDINKDTNTNEPMEIDYDIKGGMEIKSHSDQPAIEIVKNDVRGDNQELKSVEFNLEDKDDKPNLEEGILIIDADNDEGTVVTIDDIIDNTQDNYKSDPIIGVSSEHIIQEKSKKEACQSMDKNKTFDKNTVDIKDNSRPIENAKSDSNSQNVMSDSTKEVRKDPQPSAPIEIVNIGTTVLKVAQSDSPSKNNILSSVDNKPTEIGVAVEDKQIPQNETEDVTQIERDSSSIETTKESVEGSITSSLDKTTEYLKKSHILSQSKPKDVTLNEEENPNRTSAPTVSTTSKSVEDEPKNLVQQSGKGFETSVQVIECRETATGNKTCSIASVELTGDEKIDNVSKNDPTSYELSKSKIVSQQKHHLIPDIKAAQSIKQYQPLSQKYEKKETQIISKDIHRVPIIEPPKSKSPNKHDITSTSTETNKGNVKSKMEIKEKAQTDPHKMVETQPINNNQAAVPFGQWTEANRQEFLNKFKSKVPVNTSNSSQLKNSNDLNRRDVLKKIDSQRQTSNAMSKTQEANKLNMKNETAFLSKTNIINKDTREEHNTVKAEIAENKSKSVSRSDSVKMTSKQDTISKVSTQHDAISKVSSKQDTISKVSSKQDAIPKVSSKQDTITKVSSKQDTIPKVSPKQDTIHKVSSKQEMMPKTTSKLEIAKTQNKNLHITKTNSNVTKSESSQRKGLKELIDKTIEGMIHKVSTPPKASQDEPKNNTSKEINVSQTAKYPQIYQLPDQAAKLDDIEMKMNELHGIPFIERPPHELPQPQVSKTDAKNLPKSEKEKLPVSSKTKIPNLLPFPNKSQNMLVKESGADLESDDEIIEHEPITGDIQLNKKYQTLKPTLKAKLVDTNIDKLATEAAKKAAIITEKDFDKFARRNSVTYENCLTVNYDTIESQKVVQAPLEKDLAPKTYSKTDNLRYEAKTKPVHNKYHSVHHTSKHVNVPHVNKFGSVNDPDSANRNQSKVQKAYQSALTEKRQKECPITIIEDKPVKVVFMDNVEFIPGQLNVQGKELSPAKKLIPGSFNEVSMCDSPDSDTFEVIDDVKSQEIKTKTKHQRKQVLTPVEEPELELIEPKDLGMGVSPKKKRKTDEDRMDKLLKYPVRKKFYQYTVPEEKISGITDLPKNPLNETISRHDIIVNPVSAIDSLVKAAELLETQTENLNKSTTVDSSSTPSSQSGTPVKRGRGRPRKYPLLEGAVEKKPSPQKKPRLIESKVPKRRDTTTDEEDSDDLMIKENWTMGKINENIVCPICNKLFRTENVVFKHVKHCTGPSPSRSDSDKRSLRRMRQSQESDSRSVDSKSDMDLEEDDLPLVRKETPKKRKSKDSVPKPDYKDEVIVIEDTPVKDKPETKDERKHHEPKKLKTKIFHKNNDLVCEFCGKTFRQLSYLVSHKLQHKKDESKKIEKLPQTMTKPVHSCEVCKKEFRKLHHLVQHRIIHNPPSAPVRSVRKSSEKSDNNIEKEPSTSKQNEDPSAGFRCEPCDKSFRKLHHLVEHRETHDGINSKQKPTSVTQPNVEKSDKATSLHQCDVCKKTFRKLHYLIEHKEQHLDTGSEKSDDKSVKSCLSTRDIIHECSLCYMVFPNEHSLNKHTVNCSRKKRQSKQLKTADKIEASEETNEMANIDVKIDDVDDPIPIVDEIPNIKDKEEKKQVIEKSQVSQDICEVPKNKPEPIVKEVENQNIPKQIENKPSEPLTPAKREFIESIKEETIPEVPEKIKKTDQKEIIKIQNTPKKKTHLKEKPTSAKRTKTQSVPASDAAIKQEKPVAESSDDDEIRYMLNPNFKNENVTEEKVFMTVRANKRSSLQIERPNSKDLVKRRTSLQHPPKIPRLKPKTEINNTVVTKSNVKIPKEEPVPSTDSDDSETIKYSFPKTIPEKTIKPVPERAPKEVEKKTPRKSLAEKRKTLSAIAKRKSLGKAVTARYKPSPVKQIKKRTCEAEHRCDCGQLFSSAALLSRHTSLAHTPPRIRRRRSPAPEPCPSGLALKNSTQRAKAKSSPVSRKSSVKSDSSEKNKPEKSEAKSRKSNAKEMKTPATRTKPEKSDATSNAKPRRTGAHRGVPVPEKMKKLMTKTK